MYDGLNRRNKEFGFQIFSAHCERGVTVDSYFFKVFNLICQKTNSSNSREKFVFAEKRRKPNFHKKPKPN